MNDMPEMDEMESFSLHSTRPDQPLARACVHVLALMRTCGTSSSRASTSSGCQKGRTAISSFRKNGVVSRIQRINFYKNRFYTVQISV